MGNTGLPIRKRRMKKTVTWSTPLTATRFIPSRDNRPLCYCHKCKYEVLCEWWDLPEDKAGPIDFVPKQEDDHITTTQKLMIHDTMDDMWAKYDEIKQICDRVDPKDWTTPSISQLSEIVRELCDTSARLSAIAKDKQTRQTTSTVTSE